VPTQKAGRAAPKSRKHQQPELKKAGAFNGAAKSQRHLVFVQPDVSDAVALEQEWNALAKGLREEASDLEIAERLARMKDVHEALHPETRHGAAPGAPGGGKAKDRRARSFVEQCFLDTGWRHPGTISAYVKLAHDIDEAVRDRIHGTTLANKVEMLKSIGQLRSKKQQLDVVTICERSEVKAKLALRTYLSVQNLADSAVTTPILGSTVRDKLGSTVLYGDCLARLGDIPMDRVQTCVTSPPFFGMRDFGTRSWFGGDPKCKHSKKEGTCSSCGAWFGQLGLEPHLATYIDHMVEVFSAVRRVLRPDGTCWIEIGDSYNAGSTSARRPGCLDVGSWRRTATKRTGALGIGTKNLLLVPQRLALALHADGWIVRAEIIWNKTTCLPESATDRPTRSHSTILMLSKSANYYYDHEAGKEPVTGNTKHQGLGTTRKLALPGSGNRSNSSFHATTPHIVSMRNMRSVWTFAPEQYKGAHSAVFPSGLPRRCVAVSTRPGDIVLDPFAGSGTTLAVAKQLGRSYIGIELNERECRRQIEQRLAKVAAPSDSTKRALGTPTKPARSEGGTHGAA
jgi:DNA modification methylase